MCVVGRGRGLAFCILGLVVKLLFYFTVSFLSFCAEGVSRFA
jgi:hypothetical protein